MKYSDVKDYVCFDLETTGFGSTAEIIEFGAVKVRDNEIVDKFSELVKTSRRISAEVTELTGITQSDVENCRSISEVLPDFLDFIEDEVLVGHNISRFDIRLLRQAIHNETEIKFEPMYVDTLYLAQKINSLPDCKLNTVLMYYGIQNERAHRAFEDCEATHRLFLALKADGFQPSINISFENKDNAVKAKPVPKEHLEISFSDEQIESVAGKKIVLTGEFEFGSREAVETMFEARGALIRNSIGAKTDYLIVGSYGSEKWKYENGGGKIKAAQELGVKILPEKAVSNILHSTEVKNG